MKQLMYTLAVGIMTACTAIAGGKDDEAVKAAVISFVKGADTQNALTIEFILHKDFRAVVNRQFGSNQVSLITKDAYLDLLKAGKLGGDERTISIESIRVVGNNAFVLANLKGEKMVFTTNIQLIKDLDGKWKVISDMPDIIKVQ